MTQPARFSGYVRLPARSVKLRPGLIFGLGMLLPLVIVFLVFSGVRIPSAFDPRNWELAHYAVAIVTFGLLALAAGVIFRRAAAVRIRRRMNAWCDQPPRLQVEHAAADLYASNWEGKAARTASVAAFLAAVPAADCRAIVVGEIDFEPRDDGLLFEEADALEGRAGAVPKALLFLVGLGLLLQLSGVVLAGGINPLYWSTNTWLRMIPAAMNAAMLALVYGLVRTPGKAAIVTPRRVQHTWMGRTRDFTTEDSVMYVVGGSAGPQIAVALFRNDGAHAVLAYPSAKTPGFHQLINRWCMLAPADPPGPAPSPVAVAAPGG